MVSAGVNQDCALISAGLHSLCIFCWLVRSCSLLLVPSMNSMLPAMHGLHTYWPPTDRKGSVIVLNGFLYKVLEKDVEQYR